MRRWQGHVSVFMGLRLGLIGDNIRESRAPALHRACGRIAGINVSYDRFIPSQLGMDFRQVFGHVQKLGLAGVNLTLPYKEQVLASVEVSDPDISRIGAVNTVVFTDAGPKGFNTDFSGFVSAWKSGFGDAVPGQVVMFGAGGVGKAVAFGLERLRAGQIIIVDPAREKAEALAAAIAAGGRTRARVGAPEDVARADGLVNCTPLGMVGYGGTPLPEHSLGQPRWAFDAVYTPVDTPFRAQVEAAGAAFLSGFELFFHQGVDAFEIFTGIRIDDHPALRASLALPADGGV